LEYASVLIFDQIVSDWFRPPLSVDAIGKHVLAADTLQADDTSVPAFAAGNKKTCKPGSRPCTGLGRTAVLHARPGLGPIDLQGIFLLVSQLPICSER